MVKIGSFGQSTENYSGKNTHVPANKGFCIVNSTAA